MSANLKHSRKECLQIMANNGFIDRGNFTVNAMGVAAETPAAAVSLWNTIVFPYSLASATLNKPSDVAALEYALNSDRQLAVFYQLPEIPDEYASLRQETFRKDGVECCVIGTLVRVVKDIRLPDGSHQVVLRGLKRIIYIQDAGRESTKLQLVRYRAHITSDGEEKLPGILARQEALKSMFMEFASMHPGITDDLRNSIASALQQHFLALPRLRFIQRCRYQQRKPILPQHMAALPDLPGQR